MNTRFTLRACVYGALLLPLSIAVNVATAQRDLDLEQYANDQLHLNRQGYVLWAKLISKRLAEVLDTPTDREAARVAEIDEKSPAVVPRAEQSSVAGFRRDTRPRLAVLTDIGGDPDDQQSLIRLMLYANEFEIEALIASASGTPGELKAAVTRPDLISEIVGAYGAVLPNLKKHATGWPPHEHLAAVSDG